MKKLLLCALALLAFVVSAEAADYSAEVMSVRGTAKIMRAGASNLSDIHEGDLVRQGDQIEVGPQSYVDLAYDKEWNNLTRFGANSKTTLESIFPTGLTLDRGDLFSKLKKMPKGTTFEVRTPSAVAAVRGTEFLVSVDEKGATDVVGFENQVEVFNLDAQGNLGERVVVEASQKTEVNGPDQGPTAPEPIDLEKVKDAVLMSQQMDQKVEEFEKEGRFANVQTVGTVEAMEKMEDAYLGPAHKPSTNSGDHPESGRLTPEQMSALKEQFVRLGGDPETFDQHKDDFETLDPKTFDQSFQYVESGDIPYPTGSTLPPPDGTTATGEDKTSIDGNVGGTLPPPPGDSTLAGGDSLDPKMPPPPEFDPPDTGSIDQTIQQTQQQIDQSTANTMPPPPPPPDDPCLQDPSKCTTSSTHG